MKPDMKRDHIYAAMERMAAEAEAKIASCHERRACPTCGRPKGLLCVRKSSALAGVGPPLKHPHEARWTPDVPKR